MRHLAKADANLRGVIEADGAYFGGRRKGNRGRRVKNKEIVFGIKESKRGGRVHVEMTDNAGAKELATKTLKVVRKGSMICTDKWRGHDTLVTHGYRRKSVNHSKTFGRGPVHISGMEGFWNHAKGGLAKRHGISRDKFVLYIKEMEWKYNNRDKGRFQVLVDYMLGTD